MVTKTWFHFLPEVGGSVKMRANDLLVEINRRNELQRKVQELDEQILEEEGELMIDVKRDWSQKEIEEAKQLYAQHLGIDIQENVEII